MPNAFQWLLILIGILLLVVIALFMEKSRLLSMENK